MTHLAFLLRTPLGLLGEELERFSTIRYVIVRMRFRVDVESGGQLPVALKPGTLIVAL